MAVKNWLRTRTGRVVAGLIGLVVVAALVIGLLWATNTLGWRKWRINEVQQFIGAELPTNAQAVQFMTDNQKTRIVWLRFTMSDENEVLTFVDSLSLGAELEAGFTPFPAANPNEAAISWWTPQAAQTYSGLYAIHDDKVYELLVNRDDGLNMIVYARVYATKMG
jgi:hypothetical protein